jgi:hypothetical protein
MIGAERIDRNAPEKIQIAGPIPGEQITSLPVLYLKWEPLVGMKEELLFFFKECFAHRLFPARF